MNDKARKAALSILFSGSLTLFSAQFAKAAMGSSELAQAISEAKILDPRIQLTINVNGPEAQVSMFVNPNTSTFETDCKDSALSIGKTLIDADHDLKSVAVQFRSYRSKDYKQIEIVRNDVNSFNDGSLSKDDFLQKLELKYVPAEGSSKNVVAGASDANTGNNERTTVAAATAPSAPADDASVALRKHRDPQDKFDNDLAAFRAKLAKSNSKSSGATAANTGDAANSKSALKNATKTASTAKAPEVRLSQTYDDKNHLYKSEWMAFYYPEDWTHQRAYKNYWATPDERDIAQFVSKVTPGAAVTAALYIGLSLEQKLDSEEKLAAVYNYEIIPRNLKIGYEERVPAISLESVRKGQNGEELFFRRIYFMVGRQLCSLTLSCLNTDQQKMNSAFASLLGTIHSPHK